MNVIKRAELERVLRNTDSDDVWKSRRKSQTLLNLLLRDKTEEELISIAEKCDIKAHLIKGLESNSRIPALQAIKIAYNSGKEIILGRSEDKAVLVFDITEFQSDEDLINQVSSAVTQGVNYFLKEKDAVNEGFQFIKNRISYEVYRNISKEKGKYGLVFKPKTVLDTVESVLYTLGVCLKVVPPNAEALPLTKEEFEDGFASLSFNPHVLTDSSRVVALLKARTYETYNDRRVTAFALNYLKTKDLDSALAKGDSKTMSYLLCTTPNRFGCRISDARSTEVIVNDDNFETCFSQAKDLAVQRLHILKGKFGEQVFKYLRFPDFNISWDPKDYEEDVHPNILGTLLFALDISVVHNPANYPKHLAEYIADLKSANEMYHPAHTTEEPPTAEEIFDKADIEAIAAEIEAQDTTADAKAEKEDKMKTITITIPDIRKDQVTSDISLHLVYAEIARQFYVIGYDKAFKVGTEKFRFKKACYGSILENLSLEDTNRDNIMRGVAIIEALPLAESITKGEKYWTWFPMLGFTQAVYGENSNIDAVAKTQGWIFESKDEAEKVVTISVQQALIAKMMANITL